MSDTDDLQAFLQARWDEEEQAALTAGGGGRWHYHGSDSVAGWALYDEHWTIANLTTYRHESYDYATRMPAVPHPRYVDADANGAHMAYWDPKRVLDLIAAHRRILGYLAGNLPLVSKLLAQPYAAHPDYRQEWQV